jgi:hypothetical protein
MEKIFLVVVIIGTVGVLIIAGIVSYQFIREQIQEQKDRQRAINLENATLQDEYDIKFRAYVAEATEKCGLDKKCWDPPRHFNFLKIRDSRTSCNICNRLCLRYESPCVSENTYVVWWSNKTGDNEVLFRASIDG